MSRKGLSASLVVCLSVALGLVGGYLCADPARAAAQAAANDEGKESPNPSTTAAPPEFAYAGVDACRLCHKSAKQGKQYGIWKESKHAKAFEVLKSEEALKVAAERGMAKAPVESAECLKCHATGWNLNPEQQKKFLNKKYKVEDGVQCETCHGPGEKYKKLSVMKDRELAVKNGMIVGDEKLCRTCHNEEAPSWDPERFTTKDGRKVGFDFATCWDMIKHPVPE